MELESTEFDTFSSSATTACVSDMMTAEIGVNVLPEARYEAKSFLYMYIAHSG